MDAHLAATEADRNVSDVATLFGDLWVLLRDEAAGVNAERAWNVTYLVMKSTAGAVTAALKCGLAPRLLELLRSCPLEQIKPYHTNCLFSLSFKATAEDANALVAAGAVPIAVRLPDHSDSLCVSNAATFLQNVLFHTWGTADDGLPHPHFGTYVDAGADKVMLALFRKATRNAYQKNTAAVALCQLYKNKALPADWGDVCQQMIALVDGDNERARSNSLNALQCIVTVQGLLSLNIALKLDCFFSANNNLFCGEIVLAKLKAHCRGSNSMLTRPSLVILTRLHEAGTEQVQAAVRAAVDMEWLGELCCNGDAGVQGAAKKLFVVVEGEGGYEGKKYMGLLQKRLHSGVSSLSGSGYGSVCCLCIFSIVDRV
jgi:hypothetical protein